MSERTLNPKQRTLQSLALRQLDAARETMERLKVIPACQADREALSDSLDWLKLADGCLRDWFGGVPEEFAEHCRNK